MANEQTQTSFIPKESIAQKEQSPRKKKRGIGLFVFIAILVFLVSAIGAVGVVVYKSILERQVSEAEASLERARATFDPLLIEDLQALDRKLRVSDTILGRHLMTTPLFDVLSDLTMRSVRYSAINYAVNREQELTIDVSMQGQARSYTSIALQADLLSDNRYILDPLFTDLNTDAGGNVLFQLSFRVDPSLVNYVEYITRQNDGRDAASQGLDAQRTATDEASENTETTTATDEGATNETANTVTGEVGQPSPIPFE